MTELTVMAYILNQLEWGQNNNKITKTEEAIYFNLAQNFNIQKLKK